MSDSDSQQAAAFATEANVKYDEFIDWMIRHWPQRSDPLSTADFNAGKREMALLLGAKLHASGDGGQPVSDVAPADDIMDSGQYLPVTPAPWP